MDFEKIKLIIWDLDNTFWAGTISEGEIQPILTNIELIKSLTECGIINSICSKNNYDIAAKKLIELNVFNYFVFPSIDWTSKGLRIKGIISSMLIREVNVLYIDDEVTNLEEAKYYSPQILVAGPEIIDSLRLHIASLSKSDLMHTRLNNYKLLETKSIEKKKFDSNEEFLYANDIQVTISENCEPVKERIHELLIRSNQLNFTKKRISYEEFSYLLTIQNAKCGYISLSDKYGDYGIVGFYALINNKLEHFFFSCQTIGQGIEQYVYALLNYPEITIVGEVAVFLSKNTTPKWINQKCCATNKSTPNNKFLSGKAQHAKILVKGLCDLSHTMNYIKHNEHVRCEFSYVNDCKANVIDAHNHSIHILGLKDYTEQEKQEIINDCHFVDPQMLDSKFFEEKYDVIFLSTLIESSHGIYKKYNSKIKVVFGEAAYPLTDNRYWDKYINKTINTSNNTFTEEYLSEFSKNYRHIGHTKPVEYIERLTRMLHYLGKHTILCLIIGVEINDLRNTDPAYINRHINHIELNKAIREFALANKQIKIIDLNDFVKSECDYTRNINNYTSRVYYEISQSIISIINESLKMDVQNISNKRIYLEEVLKNIKEKIILQINNKSPLYKFARIIYQKIDRKKNNS